MASLKVHITFPENKIKEPVIYQIGQEFKVVEGDQYLCFAGAGDKFDFKSTLGIDLDDCTKVAGFQAMLRNIMNQYDTFE